jgi:hypothetical protein
MTAWKWRRTCLLALIACLAVGGCSAVGYRPAPDDQTGAFPSERGSDNGGGSSM